MEPAFDLKLMFDYPDPYPLFAELRRSSPVMRFETPERKGYTITKYDDCLAVLKSDRPRRWRPGGRAHRTRTIISPSPSAVTTASATTWPASRRASA
jgi:hypothetical protein